ncbi:MAG: PAS domain-containing protein [Verrucomicrobia bacterium]|nr:PAS domain-containing protein [Verrucomicrobiota bacterium]
MKNQLESKSALSGEIGFKVLFELTNDAVFVADADEGILLDANSRALELVGRAKSELVGRHHTHLHPEVERSFLAQSFLEAPDEERDEPITCGVLTAEGYVVPCEIRAQRVKVGESV